MAYTVFFKEGKDLFTAGKFIDQQPEGHRSLLKTVAGSLAINGSVVHPLVSKKSKGEWSLLIQDDHGDVYNYTLYISRLEQDQSALEIRSQKPPIKVALMIIDPSGPRDSMGGYHPGYWSVDQYASFLEENQRDVFQKTIDLIRDNIPSDTYSDNADGSIAIHIHRKGKAYNVSITCRAEWM